MLWNAVYTNKMEMIWHKTHISEYFINENGEIRTFDRCEYMPYKNSVRKVKRNGKILNPIELNNGYLCIDLSSKGKIERMSVHRLMAQTFFCESIDGKHIHHIDGNKKNNKISNLKIIDSNSHFRNHNFERKYQNKTGYRYVHKYYKNTYRGSIQRSGKKTLYTKIYDTAEEAYKEVKDILRVMEENN